MGIGNSSLSRSIHFAVLLLAFNSELAAATLAANNVCLNYKTVPSLKIKVPSHSVAVVQPEKNLNLLHGNVVATFSEEYEIEYGADKAGGGYCVFIEGITATIGYTDFVIQIDRRHPKGSCEFNATKEHENEHIDAHLSVINDGKKSINRALYGAANNVLPIFAASESDIERAMDDMERRLQDQPQLKLLRQKLNAEQEIKNKKIDLNDKGERIRQCME